MLRDEIFEASTRYFLQPIAQWLEDASVTEVMINRFDEIYIEREGRIHPTPSRFQSEDALQAAMQNVAQWVGRELNAEQPILDARLPDGSRVNAILPPGSRGGLCVTIRKFTPGGLTIAQLLALEGLSPAAAEFLAVCVRLRKNIVIAGGTGTGKTSLLGAVSEAIPEQERIVVIEDTSELKLRQPHAIYLEVQKPDEFGRGGLSIRQLFVTSLRMRPDRIIVGEVRGGEALDMLQAMLSGHSGSLTTVHASSPRDALIRLETLSLMSDIELPIYVARAQVAAAIDIVVQLQRFTADGSRRVTQIAEVEPLEGEQPYRFRELFRFQTGDRAEPRLGSNPLQWTGQRPSFAQDARAQGLLDELVETADLWSNT